MDTIPSGKPRPRRGTELSNEVFTIDIAEDGKTYTVSSSGFDGVANRQQVGSIQVKKVDPEGKPLAGVSFLLEYSQDGKNWKSVTFRGRFSAGSWQLHPLPA